MKSILVIYLESPKTTILTIALISECFYQTKWKFRNFSVTQILREIKFEVLKMPFAILVALNFVDLVHFCPQKVLKTIKKIVFQCPQNLLK